MLLLEIGNLLLSVLVMLDGFLVALRVEVLELLFVGVLNVLLLFFVSCFHFVHFSLFEVPLVFFVHDSALFGLAVLSFLFESMLLLKDGLHDVFDELRVVLTGGKDIHAGVQ